METTLLLNATYEPLQIVPWKKALRMLFQHKVEVVAEYDREIHSVHLVLKLPAVLRLSHYVKVHRSHNRVKFTRSNLYARDDFSCQYCGHTLPGSQLTYDHVVPVARGGPKNWENIVTCCVACNRRKGDRTPEEAGLTMLRRPKAPTGFPHQIRFQLQTTETPDVWKQYIFWGTAAWKA